MSKEEAQEIINNWPLDDWSITKECFAKIIEILPFGSTIMEIGSGHSTRLLSKFYNMISLESSEQWMNKYDSHYIYAPIVEMESVKFGKTKWIDRNVIEEQIKDLNYDLLLVDAGGDRVGIYDNMDMFKTNIPIIFDDTMNESYVRCATLIAHKYNKTIETVLCAVNPKAVHWFKGKKYSIIV